MSEEYDPSTWYEAIDGTHYCSREVWDEAVTDRCIWHADVAEKPVEELVTARSEGPERLDRAVFPGIALPDFLSLSGCRLHDANLADADFEEADLDESGLREADLGGASLRDAVLTEADLREADLGNANLEGADLRGANLRDADLNDASLHHARLRDAFLGFADLRDAVLADADLGDADLYEADLGGANLRGADLRETDLWDADLRDANLRDAELGGAAFVDADLDDANLRDADLGGANLRDSSLSDTTFQNATVTGANLERTNCSRANLFDADLTGAGLFGAVLADVQLNTDTTFGTHYTDGDGADPDKAAWTLRQLERLFRENALPAKARSAFLDRKDHRRRQYWHRAIVPEQVRWMVAGGKAGARRVRDAVGARLETLVNSFGGGGGAEDGENEETGEAGDEAGTAPPAADSGGDAAGAAARAAAIPGNLTRWERLVATVKWTHTAGAGVTTRYATSPWRVVGVSLAVIAASTVAYKLVGPLVRPPRRAGATLIGGDIAATVPVTLPAWLSEWLTSLYFSVVTFTTLGYGDLRPANGAAQAVATVESFVGALLLALLVYVLGRRATW